MKLLLNNDIEIKNIINRIDKTKNLILKYTENIDDYENIISKENFDIIFVNSLDIHKLSISKDDIKKQSSMQILIIDRGEITQINEDKIKKFNDIIAKPISKIEVENKLDTLYEKILYEKEEIKRITEANKFIRKLRKKISSTLNYRNLLNTFSNEILNKYQFDDICFLINIENINKFKLFSYNRTFTNYFDGIIYPINNSLFEYFNNNDNPHIKYDIQKSKKPYDIFLLSNGIKSYIAYPIKSFEKVNGIILLCNFYKKEIDKSICKILEELEEYFFFIFETVSFQEKSLKSEEKYSSLIENASEGIVIEQNSVIKYSNRKFSSISLYSKNELKEIAIEKIFSSNLINQLRKKSINNKIGSEYFESIESKLLDRKGNVIYIEVSANSIEHFGSRANLIFIRDINSKKELEKENEIKNKRLRIVNELMKIINKRKELDFIFSELGKKLVEVIKFDVGAIVLATDKIYSDFYELIKTNFDNIYKSGENRKINYTPTKWVIENRCTYYCGDIRNDKRFQINTDLLFNELYSHLVVPLISEDYIIGSINLCGKTPYHFSKTDIELLEQIGIQIGIAISKARLVHDLENSNKVKDEFINNISHELKTPLNAILGFSQFLRKILSEKIEKKYIENIADIYRSGIHLLNLINNIIIVSSYRGKRLPINVIKIDIDHLINYTKTLGASLLGNKNIKFSIEKDDNLNYVYSDLVKLQHIVSNLISNAIKFTTEGHIKVNFKLENNEYFVIIISDTGEGIKEEDKDIIFEEFRQLHTSLTNRSPGTGLGLALTKKYVEALYGRISVRSEKHKGSEFRVKLPDFSH